MLNTLGNVSEINLVVCDRTLSCWSMYLSGNLRHADTSFLVLSRFLNALCIICRSLCECTQWCRLWVYMSGRVRWHPLWCSRRGVLPRLLLWKWWLHGHWRRTCMYMSSQLPGWQMSIWYVPFVGFMSTVCWCSRLPSHYFPTSTNQLVVLLA